MSQSTISSALRYRFSQTVAIIPSASIVNSTAGSVAVFQTVAPHRLTSGLSVNVSNHAGALPAVDGSYTVIVLDSTKFSLKNPATDAAVSLTSSGSGGEITANLTAWPNGHFVPVNGVPYQRVTILFAKPQNPTYGGPHVRENGFMQVDLYYPKNEGTTRIEARIEQIRSNFKRGDTFEQDGVMVHVSATPESMNPGPEDESYTTSVRIPFWADVFE